MPDEKIAISQKNAPLLREWLASRGGVCVWHSLEISSAGPQPVFTPATRDGEPYPSPHWKYGKTPHRIVTDPSDFVVEIAREAERGSFAFGSNRARKAVTAAAEKHGLEAFGELADNGDVVIMVVERKVPLSEYEEPVKESP